MSPDAPSVQDKLAALQAEFADCEPRDRLLMLLDFAEKLPALPEAYRAERDAGLHRVPECQTPVFLWVDLVGGKIQIHADVAPEAPTVKGFVGVLVEAFNGATAEAVLATPSNLVQEFGLTEALGMVRMRGLYAIHARILRDVRAILENAGGN